MYKVCLDDGHGLTQDGEFNPTAGKRTPPMEDGRVIYENEFNRAVVAELGKVMERCGIAVVYAAPGDEDASLSQRVKVANDANVDIFVSIHYNAYDGKFGTHMGGISTYHYPGSTKGTRLAELIHKHVLEGTPQQDRGVQEAKFYVLRYTKMPAALLEAGFMDVLEEAKLMLNKDFQIETAEQVGQGICEYFGVPYIPRDTGGGTGDLQKIIDEQKKTIERYKEGLAAIKEESRKASEALQNIQDAIDSILN